MSNVSGLTARMLFQKSNREIVKNIVNDLMRTIDTLIATTHQSGFNYIEYELPLNFSINNVSKSDAQTLIYSELLTIYKTPEPKGKGFDNVAISITPTKTTLYINWINGMDNDERVQRKKIINSCLLK